MATDVTNLTSLVNENKVRRSIKRLFTGTVAEILGELFQNSQRANATEVKIATTEDSPTYGCSFVYADNGHGLKDGVQGLHALLRIAESDFDNPTIGDQDPMGLGIHALLASDEVKTVVFESNGVGISIDTSRWWTDEEYYSTWFQRRFNSPRSEGLLISVICTKKFIKDIHTITNSTNWQHRPNQTQFVEYPARGYEGILNITLDGNPIDTSVPSSAVPGPLVRTTYKGCPITIGTTGFEQTGSWTGSAVVNWYGQLIVHPINLRYVGAYIEVKEGRPVNPMAPARRGLIEDTAFLELVNFVRDEYFKAAFDPANESIVPASVITNCFRLDEACAIRESPYLVARGITANLSDYYKDVDERQDEQKFLYENAPTIVGGMDVTVHFSNSKQSGYSNGLSLFLEASEVRAYEFIAGDRSRVQLVTPIWEPGEQHQPDHSFYKPGRWGFARVDDAQAEVGQWYPLRESAMVVAFEDAGTYLDYLEFATGTNNVLEFLDSEIVFALFDPGDSDSWDNAEEQFNESVEALKRQLIGNCVPRDFTRYDLLNCVKGQITRIDFHYEHDTTLTSITVTATEEPDPKTLKVV